MIDQARQRDARDSGSDGEPIRVTRRQAMAMGATAPLAVVSSPFTAPTDLGTDFLRANFDRLGGWTPREEVVLHDGDQPSVHIPYREGDKASLQEWVDASDDRELLATNDAINTATVIVAPGDLQAGLTTDSALGGVTWLDDTEAVDLSIAVSRPDPVDDLSQSDAFGQLNRGERWAMRLTGSLETPVADGVAFDGAPEGSVTRAREVTGAGNSESFWPPSDATITVAVIDTGFNTAGGSILGDTTRVLDASKSFVAGETVGQNGLDAVADGNGHGTHVGSTICADPTDSSYSDYQGYLPGADLLVLKALADDGSGSTADIARAITYAADEGADVICMSLGSPVWSAELERALAYAVGSDAVPFVAAGNDRQGTRWVNSPSDSPEAITVAAGTVEPPSEAESAYFSNIGPDPGTTNFSGGATLDAAPDVAAPGMKLTALTADTTGSVSTTTLSGTSMANPCVCGCAGILLAETSVEHDVDAVRDRLTEYAARVPNMGETECGHGYPDVQAAIDETAPDETQADARSDDAEARDQAYRQLSDAYGNQIASYLL